MKMNLYSNIIILLLTALLFPVQANAQALQENPSLDAKVKKVPLQQFTSMV